MSDGLHFGLLETMRAASGEVALLERHLQRLAHAARDLGFMADVEAVRRRVQEEAAEAGEAVLRLTVERDGSFALQRRTVPAVNYARIRLAAAPVASTDAMLSRKTTARAVYEAARAGFPPDVDALLVNERDEITESTIANVALLRGGAWVTPAAGCGLLPGVMRAELLERGEIAEGVIPAKELTPGQTVRCFNAVRGIYDTVLI